MRSICCPFHSLGPFFPAYSVFSSGGMEGSAVHDWSSAVSPSPLLVILSLSLPFFCAEYINHRPKTRPALRLISLFKSRSLCTRRRAPRIVSQSCFCLQVSPRLRAVVRIYATFPQQPRTFQFRALSKSSILAAFVLQSITNRRDTDDTLVVSRPGLFLTLSAGTLLSTAQLLLPVRR